MKHLITLKDFSSGEIREILETAQKVKKKWKAGEETNYLSNKTLIMLFQKTSTRTRLSFEAGMTQLGGHAIFLDWRTTQFQIAEFIDEIRATMRFGDILMFRALKNQSLVDAEKVATIPVINALCEKYHPCQALGDALTIIENSGGIAGMKGKKVVWLGIGNNVSNSLVNVCTKLGAKVTLCIPEKNKPSVDKDLEDKAKATGLYEETTDLSCLKDADFVYTDTWVDMEFFKPDGSIVEGFRKEYERRKKMFLPYQLNKKLLDKHKNSAKIMHDMPCHPGYEITRDAIEHPNSIIFDQAENRLHAQKGILLWLLGKNV